MKLLKFLSILAVMLLPLAASHNPANAQDAESTWDRIKRTQEIRFAVFNYPPYFVKNRETDQWEGALVAMAADVAKELKVELKPVEVGGWGELVLALTTSKVDLAAGMPLPPETIRPQNGQVSALTRPRTARKPSATDPKSMSAFPAAPPHVSSSAEL